MKSFDQNVFYLKKYRGITNYFFNLFSCLSEVYKDRKAFNYAHIKVFKKID